MRFFRNIVLPRVGVQVPVVIRFQDRHHDGLVALCSPDDRWNTRFYQVLMPETPAAP